MEQDPGEIPTSITINMDVSTTHMEQCHSVTIDVCSEVPKEHCVDEPQEKCLDVPRENCKNLKNTTKVRRDRIVAATQLHEYNRESGQFLAWIREMMAGARSEDPGKDYEHLEILLARFKKFKVRVQAGENKLSNCEYLAKRLESVDKGVSNVEVKEVQAKFTEEWMSLIEAIEKRGKNLESAGEIHRDIAEALSRIGEKSTILQTDDTARDTKSAQSHLRKHDGFENDLVSPEVHLKVLIDDSAVLQDCYPGEKTVSRKSVGGTKMTPCEYLSVKNKTPQRKTVKTPGSIQKKTESQIPRVVEFAREPQEAPGH